MLVRIFTEPQQGATYEQQLAVARTAEELGFDAFFRSDHYLLMGGGDPLPGPTDAWITIAGLARDTSTIRLGTLVNSATFRLPGPLAISVAEVDAMSGGRVELGLGAGWFDDEHRAYGIPFPELGERFDRLEEQLAIVTGLWSTPVGDTFSFTGTHYSVLDSPALPKPVQDPVPVIVGGGGPRRTPALAARFATEYNLAFPAADVFEHAVARVQAACDAIHRDPASIRQKPTCNVAPRASVAIPTSCAPTGQPARRQRSSSGSAPTKPRARRPCTCKCSISMTSNTCNCSAARCSGA